MGLTIEPEINPSRIWTAIITLAISLLTIVWTGAQRLQHLEDQAEHNSRAITEQSEYSRRGIETIRGDIRDQLQLIRSDTHRIEQKVDRLNERNGQ